ncbi:hypothetical protein [Pseudoalteromonas luteoviolacea]|uniref:Uncharacterized protein n=1 Tax=Pseudoalteromonas luteoviolacea S4054 TaxID=1129367 RepID=A0A0F6ADW2_9GAMM|nr:hypothetical protein [Pseudoalteromonas luteoviolacea]AOT08080.1 hypothetical protein S4054249_09570 [Pseudoalteromonas luteoviolacea]AOT12997.1 hypothetical protein S40542_09570 [Pseudoalteromonas luteoviolacea]AOT17909.1 hypothetical protein S4054_09565 [Pseudoalteromonas luteoviolacea]KKE84370.1 hypothetical protein N479_08995 [Pseudoalteromonas luteoviolacea S4054]KZN71745.1 hypothetical protein N481_17535 [Pseudoalteromonas luteoviolacea S4047-1]
MAQDVVKHCSLWIVFSFFYLSGLEMAVIMSIDGQPQPTLWQTLLYTFLYNALIGHLVTKYEKLWPFLASIVISLFGVVGFGVFFGDKLAGYSNELIIGLVLSLPFATFLVKQLKSKNFENNA